MNNSSNDWEYRCNCGGKVIEEEYEWDKKKLLVRCSKCVQIFDVIDKKEES